ncbi:MAG: putative molybdenum carrier protein [Planctomycetaceae bacterium]|nr:putative molybdenum carrier protein [Planctomycetaceae bacterium]
MRIISGGQTGVDRAALDAAMELGIAHGGWCPLGRLAEDGRIPDRYQLTETDSPVYAVRTERNVVESDATLILYRGRISGGTKLTLQLARRHSKPHLKVDLDAAPEPVDVCRWLAEYHIETLNVAGPRESQSPGIGVLAHAFLLRVLRP